MDVSIVKLIFTVKEALKMEISTSLIVATFLIAVFYWFVHNRRENTPPGLTGLPIVGYLPFLTYKPYVDLQNLAKTYGPVFSLRLGSMKMIVLSDFSSIRDAFFQDAFMGRPDSIPFQLSKESLETGAFNGLPWKEQRRFSLRMLKDLGLGKSRLEEMIKEEICELLAHLAESAGRPICVRPLLTSSMSNNIACMVIGRRMLFDDPDRILLDRSFSEGAKQAGQTAWRMFFPWVQKITRFVKLFRSETELDLLVRETKRFMTREIDEHRRTLDENNIRDFIDGYLLEIQKRKDPRFCIKVLEDLVGTFFGAGSETVRLTVDWLLLITASYTDVQAKIQAEIDSVVGQNRSPTWNDHLRMPYTEATIMEAMRWRTIIPLNLLRYTLWDTELNGYFIPKHSYILANFWAVHHSPEYWGKDVGIFRPERFLSEDGRDLVKSEYFIPFSIGKRACPGESLARAEVFLYLVMILQKFSIALPEDRIPDYEGELGIGLAPKTYEVCLKKRF